MKNDTWSDYVKWADEVVSIVAKAGKVFGRKPDETSTDYLDRCRGDEPHGTFCDGEPAEDYADFVMTADERDGDTGTLDPDAEI